LVRDGEAVAVGVGIRVVSAEEVGRAIEVETTGW
jgi:hypothetical protein